MKQCRRCVQVVRGALLLMLPCTHRRALRISGALLAGLVGLAGVSSLVRAETPLVTLDAYGALAITEPQSDEFGPGGAIGGSVHFALAPWALLGARLRAGLLSNGDPPADPGFENRGVGTLETLGASLRLRPFASHAAPRGHGLFIEGGAGGALTGELVRPAFEGALGYGIPVGTLSLAPTLRYVQVVQPSDPLSSEDARLLLLGIELAVLDHSSRAAEPAPQVVAPPEPTDRDQDGLPDDVDACPDEPEDFDGHLDHDGCPDLDNDADGVPDAQDECPDQPEDIDGFEDEDGCPDPDNDGDTFLDADDQCPNEPETINGFQDYDGCPDEGLIEMRDDRIVLEERVLFDLERSRIKTRARPVLDAIATLVKQHPEWVSIRIEGHADVRGASDYNQALSQRRADNVRESLIARGIPAAIIEAVGYGSEKPRDLRDDPDAHQRNRRVEFVVVARSTTPVLAPDAGQDPPPALPAAEGAAP